MQNIPDLRGRIYNSRLEYIIQRYRSFIDSIMGPLWLRRSIIYTSPITALTILSELPFLKRNRDKTYSSVLYDKII